MTENRLGDFEDYSQFNLNLTVLPFEDVDVSEYVDE